MAGAGRTIIELGIVAAFGYVLYQALTGGSVSSSSPLDAVASAIQAHEGWAPGSVSYRNNNPGNLKYAGQYAATGQDSQGFAIFPDYQSGYDALKAQLSLYVKRNPNWTLQNLFSYYLGGDPYNPQVTNQGDPFAYAADVAKRIGASVSDTLGQIFGGGSANG